MCFKIDHNVLALNLTRVYKVVKRKKKRDGTILLVSPQRELSEGGKVYVNGRRHHIKPGEATSDQKWNFSSDVTHYRTKAGIYALRTLEYARLYAHKKMGENDNKILNRKYAIIELVVDPNDFLHAALSTKYDDSYEGCVTYKAARVGKVRKVVP